MHWIGTDAAPRRARGSILLRQLNPLASRVSPLRYFNERRIEGYYQRVLEDASLASEWAAHYLAGVPLTDGAAVLDYGCGRGRHVAMLSHLGYQVAAQDIAAHAWWRHFDRCTFQVVPPPAPRLPWRDRAFEAVLDVTVIHHLDRAQLERLATEVFRVLAPGGHWILIEANDESYGAAAPVRYYGQLHSIAETTAIAASAGFDEVDRRYEGFYAPVAPTFVNFLRKQAWPGPFTLDDFDSALAAKTPPRKRALWVLRLKKPFDFAQGRPAVNG